MTAWGPGLTYGIAGEPAHFVICTKHAHGGGNIAYHSVLLFSQSRFTVCNVSHSGIASMRRFASECSAYFDNDILFMIIFQLVLCVILL